jgi:prepilin-type N-terminal cleavage/methylation domain-containing protein/prepilin-type processing-associated H-X9-DG protein
MEPTFSQCTMLMRLVTSEHFWGARQLLRRPFGASIAIGFTLVELLATLAVISLLLAVLLPSVQAARESARRTHCANNLKQLSLAALNHEQNIGLLPPAGLVRLQNDPAFELEIVNPLAGVQLSWVVLLLPYLEEQSLYDRFDLTRQVFFQDAAPQSHLPKSLECPSDQASAEPFQHAVLTRNTRFAKGNYAAFVSPFHVDLQMQYRGAVIAGGQKLSAIEDGMAQSLIFSEVRTLNSTLDERGAWALPWAGASLLAFDMHPLGWTANHDGTAAGDDFNAATCAPYLASPESLGETQRPNNQGPNADVLQLCADPEREWSALEHMPCIRWNRVLGTRGYMSAAPRSQHPTGVNATFVDGHVAFLADEIDEFVMAYGISVNDGIPRK